MQLYVIFEAEGQKMITSHHLSRAFLSRRSPERSDITGLNRIALLQCRLVPAPIIRMYKQSHHAGCVITYPKFREPSDIIRMLMPLSTANSALVSKRDSEFRNSVSQLSGSNVSFAKLSTVSIC
jgi:hypothetical protein